MIGWRPWGVEDSPTGKPGQREWAQSIVDTGRVSIVTCNGAGKSTFCAALGLFAMECYPNAQVLTTAPTWPQVDRLIWNKLRAMHAQSKRKLDGRVLRGTCEWKLAPDWAAYGMSSDDEVQFQGFHANTTVTGETGLLLVIVDEAAGVDPYVYNAIMGWATKGEVWIVYIGNANVNEGPFYDSHRSPLWTSYQLSAFDVPEELIRRDWIDEMRDTYGEDSPQWEVRVLGRFSEKGRDWQLIPLWMLEDAEENYASEHDEEHIGLDVARSDNGDWNVLCYTKGEDVKAVESWQSDDTMVTAKNTKELAEAWGFKAEDAHRIHIDATGVGGGVYDRLKEWGWHCDPVMFGGGAENDWKETIGEKQKFANRKAELHWVARELLKTHRARVRRRFKKTWAQLQWPNYDFREGTEVLLIEPKKKMQKRRGSPDSPDFGDAFVLTLSRTGSGVGAWTW